MFRKDVQLAVTWRAVVGYLLQNPHLPRSATHCLNRVEESIANLPRSQSCLRAIRDVRRQLDAMPIEDLAEQTLHEDVDMLQLGLSSIHAAIDQTWFD